MSKERFTVELTHIADADFDEIYEWTLRTFGQKQADQYTITLRTAIEALTEDAAPPGAKKRDDLGSDIFTLHIARRGRRGRHWLVYQCNAQDILVLRILHDSMDIVRHLPLNDE